MASFPPYSGYPLYNSAYSAPGAGRLNVYPGANNQNAFLTSTGMRAAYANPARSVPSLTPSLANNGGNSSDKPLVGNSEEKRPTKVTVLKCGLEMLVMTASILWGTLGGGIRPLINQFGVGAGKIIGGWIIPSVLAGFTGGIFSYVYQKMKTGAINTKTLVNDTLWGTIGC
jgi:hypothetical protein